MRQDRIWPLLDASEALLREKLVLISQKAKLAEAIRYTLSSFKGLCRFIDNGRFEIDCDTVERSIRPFALNGKNALFAKSDKSARHWTVTASLIETCKLSGVNSQACFNCFIARIIQAHSNRDIDELMPCRFQPAKAITLAGF